MLRQAQEQEGWVKLDTALQVRGWESGADHSDLITNLMTLIDSLERTGTADSGEAGQQAAARRALNAALGAQRRLARLSQRVAQLETLALTDPLTGLLNRRGFEAELEKALTLARRHGETGVLLFLDLDGFKQVNDVFGHAAGDEVLKRVGRVLMRSVRRSDVVARLGGDEFGVILARAEAAGGCRRARTLERLVNSTAVFAGGVPIAVHGSVGAHPFGPEDDPAGVLQRADAAMYDRKRDRDRTQARLRVA